MSDAKLALIRKTRVADIAIHVNRAGLAIGDVAWLAPLADGRIGVFARINRRLLGLFSRWRPGFLGHLDADAEEIITPSLQHGDRLRVRIIDLVPEHLAHGNPPEVHISVWGDPRHLQPVRRPPEPAPAIASPRRRLSSVGLARQAPS
ncbi:MAG: hypothetical protein B7Z10_04815 [Rhodobacterales bacterium 32-66-7]|nr:MAG: hypothetical protein B7Z10_04815 [Rhodobacterales bacterium 32-66-7]